MEKHAISCAAGLALLTIPVMLTTANATAATTTTATTVTEKAPEKNTTTHSTTHKKTQLLQQQAEIQTGAKGSAGMAGELGSKGNQSTELRDWAAIDTNKDHYIQPEEMEKYLNESWAAQKKAAAKAK
jgi:hypothetical protein